MNNLKRTFSNSKEIEAFVNEAPTTEIIDAVLAQNDLHFEMVVAWGSYSEAYEHADDLTRKNMLSDAIRQMPTDVLIEIFEKQFL